MAGFQDWRQRKWAAYRNPLPLHLSASLNPSLYLCILLPVYKYLISSSSHHVVNRYCRLSIASPPSITQRVQSRLEEPYPSQPELYMLYISIHIRRHKHVSVSGCILCVYLCESVLVLFLESHLCRIVGQSPINVPPNHSLISLPPLYPSPFACFLSISFLIFHFSLCVSHKHTYRWVNIFSISITELKIQNS